VAFLVFSTVILIHEAWHFFAARFFWVKVEEFWLGIPPRAKKLFTDKKWTLFSLNWLPLWWFVKLYGENPELLKNKDDKKALYNKSSFAQIIIILAWVFMNFLLAFAIFSVLFFIWIKPVWINTKIETNLDLKLIPNYEQAINSWLLKVNSWVILNPILWSIAEKSWLKKDDILYNIYTCESKMLDYLNCEWWEIVKVETIDKTNKAIEIISKNKWKDIAFYINAWFMKSDWIRWFVWWSFIKISVPKEWKIWTYIWENVEINKNFVYKFSFLESIKYGFLETKNQILLTFKWLKILVQKIFNPKNEVERKQAVEEMSWPIWIVDFISNSLSAGIIFIIIITAVISINLWVFNLLPIPALDWWRFFLISINSLSKLIFSKKIINQTIENSMHLLFFIVLIVLSLIIWYNDIIKIISR